MLWKEMTQVQKILVIVGFICVLTSILLKFLSMNDILTNIKGIEHVLYGFWCFSMGFAQKTRGMRILWYILAGGYGLLCLMYWF